MPDINKANRQVCDVLFYSVGDTKTPVLKFDTANTTTAGVQGDSVYAMAKGSRRIAFANPMEATMTLEAQVYPFKLFSLFAGGIIDSEATYAETQDVTATDANKLTIKVPANATLSDFCVFPKGTFGDEGSELKITKTAEGKVDYADGVIGCSGVVSGDQYTVGYFVTKGKKVITSKSVDIVAEKDNELNLPADDVAKIEDGTVKVKAKDGGSEVNVTYANGKCTAETGISNGTTYTVSYDIASVSSIKKIAFRNDRLPKDYYVTMSTLDKDEEGRLTPFKIVAYKATAQRNFELSFTSEGDPATVTATLIKWCPRTAMCV